MRRAWRHVQRHPARWIWGLNAASDFLKPFNDDRCPASLRSDLADVDGLMHCVRARHNDPHHLAGVTWWKE